jgi:galactokinase
MRSTSVTWGQRVNMETRLAALAARRLRGGFGGAVVVLARTGQARAIAEKVVAEYREKTGRNGAVLVPEEASGVSSRGDEMTRT